MYKYNNQKLYESIRINITDESDYDGHLDACIDVYGYDKETQTRQFIETTNSFAMSPFCMLYYYGGGDIGVYTHDRDSKLFFDSTIKTIIAIKDIK